MRLRGGLKMLAEKGLQEGPGRFGRLGGTVALGLCAGQQADVAASHQGLGVAEARHPAMESPYRNVLIESPLALQIGLDAVKAAIRGGQGGGAGRRQAALHVCSGPRLQGALRRRGQCHDPGLEQREHEGRREL